ncbi:transcriptional regulator [Streptomyces lydicus]|uniref:transcriptional regulator n=1 Tax=Streptomyces lydicus TaxID=47763 RepID=UPI003793D6A5
MILALNASFQYAGAHPLESRQEGNVVSFTKMTAPAGEHECLVASVPLSSLLLGDSPRLNGADAEHVARLAELDTPLPPILVDAHSMRVIDGMHRLMAAATRGRQAIDVAFFDGTEEEAFLHAVQANVKHGLPLSQEDRRSAVERIIKHHSQMSDRAIAQASGLNAKSVAAIRRQLAGVTPQPKARIGRDGRVHPLSSVEGRERAAALIAENPQASLREVARLAGISPATVSDVRKRLASGELPVPGRKPDRGNPDKGRVRPASSVPDAGPDTERHDGKKVPVAPSDPRARLEKLLRDPSLRLKEDGRQLLRLLSRTADAKSGMQKLAAAVPSHCTDAVAMLAKEYADMWLEFAQGLV